MHLMTDRTHSRSIGAVATFDKDSCKAVEQSDGLPWPAADTTIKGDAGAPGHYDALVLTTMHDGQIELIHKNLRRP